MMKMMAGSMTEIPSGMVILHNMVVTMMANKALTLEA